MKTVSPFKYLRDNDDKDGDIFEASFPLGTDDCPGTINNLCVRVITHESEHTEIVLSVASHAKTRPLAAARAESLQAVENLLFPVAGIETKQRIVVKGGAR